MRVRMVSTAAGPWGTATAGSEVDVPEDLGRALIAAGAAVAVGASSDAAVAPTAATAEPDAERAVRPRPRGRPRRSGR